MYLYSQQLRSEFQVEFWLHILYNNPMKFVTHHYGQILIIVPLIYSTHSKCSQVLQWIF